MARLLRHTYGVIPSPADNDGIVPTRSQAWGHVLHAAVADHLDVLGYFGDASLEPPHVDWIVTGSGFTRRRFEALWNDVARFLGTGPVAADPHLIRSFSRACHRPLVSSTLHNQLPGLLLRR